MKVTEHLALLKEQYNRLKYQDLFNSMTDNSYYATGRAENMHQMMRDLLESIRKIDPDFNPQRENIYD